MNLLEEYREYQYIIEKHENIKESKEKDEKEF